MVNTLERPPSQPGKPMAYHERWFCPCGNNWNARGIFTRVGLFPVPRVCGRCGRRWESWQLRIVRWVVDVPDRWWRWGEGCGHWQESPHTETSA